MESKKSPRQGIPNKAIHFNGYPCKVDKGRWKSAIIASTTNPEKVTCKGCIRVCTSITEAWRAKLNRDKKLEIAAKKNTKQAG